MNLLNQYRRKAIIYIVYKTAKKKIKGAFIIFLDKLIFNTRKEDPVKKGPTI